MNVLELDNYKAEVQNASVYGLALYFGVDADIDSGRPNVDVNYELQVEARNWGIKSICVVVTKITTTIHWYVDIEFLTEADKLKLISMGGTEYRNDTIGGFIEIDTTTDDKWTIETQVEIESDGALSINDVEIDFETMVITVS